MQAGNKGSALCWAFIFIFLQISLQHTIVRSMTFYSLPFTPERTQATESRLEAIYEAARYGLKGDSLAMAAGMTPRQFRVLAESDPLVEMAEIKGRTDGEYTAGKTMYEAARDGDAKAALEILKHQHGWVAKQQIDVNIDQQISITGALEKAQQRVIEGTYLEIPQLEDNSNANTDIQRIGRNGIDGKVVESISKG
jgi:ribosomal protein S11